MSRTSQWPPNKLLADGARLHTETLAAPAADDEQRGNERSYGNIHMEYGLFSHKASPLHYALRNTYQEKEKFIKVELYCMFNFY